MFSNICKSNLTFFCSVYSLYEYSQLAEDFPICIIQNTVKIYSHVLLSFSPTPRVQWIKVRGSLPFGRHTITNAGTMLNLESLEDEDQGEYKCTGSNAADTASATIQLMIQCKFSAKKMDVLA